MDSNTLNIILQAVGVDEAKQKEIIESINAARQEEAKQLKEKAEKQVDAIEDLQQKLDEKVLGEFRNIIDTADLSKETRNWRRRPSNRARNVIKEARGISRSIDSYRF